MNRGELELFSRRLRDTVGNISRINDGGCGVAAYNIMRALRKQGVECYGRVFGYEHDPDYENCDVDAARRNLRQQMPTSHRSANINDWGMAGLDLHHVMVEVVIDNGERYLLDSERRMWIDGVPEHQVFCDCWQLIPGRLSISELRGMAMTPAGWNPRFQRRGNISRVKKLADQVASEVFGLIV